MQIFAFLLNHPENKGTEKSVPFSVFFITTTDNTSFHALNPVFFVFLQNMARLSDNTSEKFQFVDYKNATFLLGTYRADKNHLDWIIGKNPYRFESLYNIRYNENLFESRKGGFTSDFCPDFVLIYNHANPSDGYHLFPCISSSKKSEKDMKSLQYPNPKGSYLVYLLGEEIQTEPLNIESVISSIKEKNPVANMPVVVTGDFLGNYVDATKPIQTPLEKSKENVLRFIDLFAGIGGIRCGLEQAATELGLQPICVFTSEIKPYAIKVLQDNHPTETISGDITKIETKNIPDFDILCAGFPCQAFSAAGNRDGFADTRGTLFFDVERILKDKMPKGFILENVEGLINHDNGKTLQVIIGNLMALGYKVNYRLLNSKDFGVPQERKRIYIVGALNDNIDLDNFEPIHKKLEAVLEANGKISNSPFVKKLLSIYSIKDLIGKSIKDKRGGCSNIHSWDIEIKGHISKEEKKLMGQIMTERRKKKWAEEWGIDWMDGMPLTEKQISTFFENDKLNAMLTHLTQLGYLKFEHPKKKVETKVTTSTGRVVTTYRREFDSSKEKGYNIVAGKLSFEVNEILDPKGIAPTLVATDMHRIYVPDGNGIRKLSLREGLRLFGYPDSLKFDITEKDGFDLLGNTVVVPVIKSVAQRLLNTIYNNGKI